MILNMKNIYAMFPNFILFLSTYLQSMFVFDIKNQKYLITANENKRKLSVEVQSLKTR